MNELESIGAPINDSIKIIRRRLRKADFKTLKEATKHSHNRDKRPHEIKKNLSAMTKGIWKDNMAAIIISETMEVIDGQHRIEAGCLLEDEDILIPITIIYNVPDIIDGEQTFTNQDINSTRKPYEVIKTIYRDLYHAKEVIALARRLDQFNLLNLQNKFSGTSTDNLTVQELVNRHQPIDSLDEIVSRAITLSDRSGEKRGKSIKNRRLSVNMMSLLVGTVGVCEGGNKFLENLVGAISVGDSIMDSRGHIIDDSDPIAQITKQLENISRDDNNHKDVRSFCAITQAYDFVVNGREVKQKFTEGLIAYPTDYTKYVVDVI